MKNLIKFIIILIILAPLAHLWGGGGGFYARAQAADIDIVGQLQADAEAAKAKSEALFSDSIWTRKIKVDDIGLDSIEDELDELLANISKITEPLKSELPRITDSFRRLSSLTEANKADPVALRIILQRSFIVSGSLKAQTEPLLTLKNMVDSVIDSMTHARDFFSSEKVSARISTKARVIERLIAEALSPANVLLEKFGSMNTEALNSLHPLWMDYYLSRGPQLFDANEWLGVPGWFEAMKIGFPLRLSVEFPPSKSDWQAALVYFANALFIGLIILFAVRYFLIRAERGGKLYKSVRLDITRDLFWMAVGLSVVAAAEGTSDAQYRGLATIGSIIFISGEVALALGVRLAQLHLTRKRFPMRPLLWVVVLGIIVSYPNFPTVVLSLIWIIICLISLVFSTKKQDALPPLETNLLRLHNLAIVCSVLASFLGWGRLAILSQIFIDCLIVSVQMILGLLVLLNRLTHTETRESERSVMGSVISALAAPTIFLLVVGGVVLWVIAMPGGSVLSWHYFGDGIKIGGASFSLINLFFILTLFYATQAAVAAGNMFLNQAMARSSRIDKTLVMPMQAGLTYGLWALFFFFSLATLGFGMNNLAVVAGGLSVGIGFGMQNIVNNFLSGLILIFSRILHEGDVIDVGNLQGTVRKISVRATTVETFDNALIFVPNSEFVSSRLTNWTRNGRLVRRDIEIGVAYGTNPNVVDELLVKATEGIPAVSKHKLPSVVFSDFGDSSLDFKLRYWADFEDAGNTGSLIRHNIVKIFKENEIEIAFPQIDVHLKNPLSVAFGATSPGGGG